MCGNPQRSRTMRTGADRPASSSVPDIWATTGCGAAGCVLQATRGQRDRAMRHTGISRRRTRPPGRGLLRARAAPLLPLLRVPAANRLSAMAIKDALFAEYD